MFFIVKLPSGWNGFENNLLMLICSQTLLIAMMAFQQTFFIGMVNTYDVCMYIAVKAHQCPLDVTGRCPVVYIASTAIGTCGIFKCCFGYLAIFGRFSAKMFHVFVHLLVSWHKLDHW